MYVDYEYYTSIRTISISELEFNNLAWEACRKLDVATTGIDNVKKLKSAFPTDEDDIEAVKRCACKLIDILYKLNCAEENSSSAQGYIQREDGSLQGKVVTSVSAGNESISYSAGKNASFETLIDKALSDESVRRELFDNTIREYLSGITDSNGVNLLFMGKYPFRC